MMTRIATLALTLILASLAVPASAQDSPPAPAPTPDRGGVLLAYNLTNLEVGMDRAAGLTLEADLRIPQAPAMSIVGHVSSTATTPGWTFSGIGPRATYDAGPLKVFGHWLVGSVKLGDAATDGVDHKAGGGIMIPLGRRWEIQIGADHDGDVAHGRIGVGWRF